MTIGQSRAWCVTVFALRICFVGEGLGVINEDYSEILSDM